MATLFSILKSIWKLTVLYLLIFITFSYAMFQGGFVSWFLFFSFLPFALYALALSFYTLKDVQAERLFVKREYNAGEQVKIHVLLKRRIRFPLFYLIAEDTADKPLSMAARKKQPIALLFPVLRKQVAFEYVIEELPRGEHVFQGFRIKTGDPLGLIEKEILVQVDNKITVYPAYEELVYRPLENQYDQGMTASRERVQRDTSMAVGVRQYQPGDRFSWINWKASAKRNDMMTKEFEQRQSHDVYILIDCAPDGRFETIVSFTASIVRAMLRRGAQVGLLTSNANRDSFPVLGGDVQQQQLFYHLARIKDDSPAAFERFIVTEALLSGQHATFMLVTAVLTKTLVERAGILSQQKGAVILFLIKKQKEQLAQHELNLKNAASARGIRVILVHDGRFSEAFLEVYRG